MALKKWPSLALLKYKGSGWFIRHKKPCHDRWLLHHYANYKRLNRAPKGECGIAIFGLPLPAVIDWQLTWLDWLIIFLPISMYCFFTTFTSIKVITIMICRKPVWILWCAFRWELLVYTLLQPGKSQWWILLFSNSGLLRLLYLIVPVTTNCSLLHSLRIIFFFFFE